MKGIVLAGGTGSRLFPLTKITNKHLLPIYDRPMIYYPIQTLVDAGIQDILIVTGGRNSGDFLRLLANGKAVRPEAHQLHLPGRRRRHRRRAGAGRTFRRRPEDLRGAGRQHHRGQHPRSGRPLPPAGPRARTSCSRKCRTPSASAWPKCDGDRIVGIEEKPAKPKSNYAVTGIYMYDATVFDKIKTLVPSGRGELEITDVNNAYIREGTMTFSYLDGWWTDAGTFESLLRAANLVAQSAAQKTAWQRSEARRDAATEAQQLHAAPIAGPPAISNWPARSVRRASAR